MYNKTIAALEAMDSASGFERLSSTLLMPLYPNINPIGGTGDQGRDATGQLREAIDSSIGRIIFQFSYQKDWERKLKSELKKTKENNLDPVRYVFVSTRRVNGKPRDRYEKWVRQTYGWELEIYDQEWLRARLESPEYLHLRQDYLGLLPDTIPLFMLPEEFVARQSSKALGTLDLPLLGRQGDIDTLSEWLHGEAPVLNLHAPGGVGKTKLCVEFARQIEVGNQLKPIFVRTEAEEFDAHLSELAPGQSYLVIIDDAHRFDHTKRLSELLSNPKIGPIKILLNTRPVFKDSITSFAGGYEVEELELQALERADLDKLITGNPFNVIDVEIRNRILDIAEGNPLIALLAAQLAANGKDVRDVSADDVFRRYLDDAVGQVLGADDEKGRDFLAILVGLGGIELGASELRAAIRTKLGLSQSDEQKLISKLVASGVLYRGYDRLRVVPDTLADHLLMRWYFDHSKRPYDFRSLILEPFFWHKAPDLMRNLALAEFKGESREASSLLSEVMNDLGDLAAHGDNAQRLIVLDWIAQFGRLRADEALCIVARIIDDPEIPPTEVTHPIWGSTTVETGKVLLRAVEVLDQTKGQRVLDSLSYLHKLSKCGTSSELGSLVRKKATESIKDLFKFKPGQSTAAYEQALTQAQRWIHEDPECAPFPTELLGQLIRVEYDWAESSPANPRQITFSTSLLMPTPWLKDFRKRIFETLRDLYKKTSLAQVRKQIIEVHETLAVYHPRRPDQALQEFLNDDIRDSIMFFNACVDEGAELFERFHIWAWAMSLKRHKGYTGDELLDLIARIEAGTQHKRYLYLGDDPALYKEDGDWEQTEKEQQAFVQTLIDGADQSSIDSLVDDLEEIVVNVRKSQDSMGPGASALLHGLGVRKPELVTRLLKRVEKERLDLRYLAAPALAGLRVGDQAAALGFAKEWTVGDDPVLHRAVLLSYRRPEGVITMEDLSLLEKLFETGVQELLDDMLFALSSFQQVDNARTIGLLKRIAARADDRTLTTVAQVIYHSIRDIDPDDFRSLIENFLRMTRLDRHRAYAVDQVLQRFGKVDPLGLLQFVRVRIEQGEGVATKDPDYEPIPNEFRFAFEGLSGSEVYPKLLREVRGWMLNANGEASPIHSFGAAVLKDLCQGVINDQLAKALTEWIDGSLEQQRAVACILRELGCQERFYDLAKKLLAGTDDNIVHEFILGAVLSTGVVSGSMVPVFVERLSVFQSWLNDTSTRLKARVFARQMVDILKTRIEYEEQRDLEEQF